jgi:hypothetical protein
MTMMTKADIQTELGWRDDMVSSLLQNPDSTKKTRRNNEYVYELYNRERVLAIAQSPDGRAAKRRWGETLGVTGRTQGGRHDSALWDACWASQRWLLGSSWRDLGPLRQACHRPAYDASILERLNSIVFACGASTASRSLTTTVHSTIALTA